MASAELEAELRGAAQRAQRQLMREKDRRAALVAAVYQGAKDAMLSMGPVQKVEKPKPTPSKGKRAEVALWDMGDWQGSKITTSYNSTVMRSRVMQFPAKVKKITDIHRADHRISDCAIIFGGDMVEGLFNFPTQPFETDATIFTQFTTVSRLIVDVVRAALADHENVQVIGEWGNHGRMGPKRAAIPRADNIDRMCFELARALLKDESRLTWQDSAEDIQRLEIGNYRALVIHGDEIGRNGFASPMTIVNFANRWRSGAYPWAFRDVYVHHYHTHAEWPMANGEGTVYQTGSTESDNRYAMETMAASARPSQRLHFIDPEKGRVTSQYKVHLD